MIDAAIFIPGKNQFRTVERINCFASPG